MTLEVYSIPTGNSGAGTDSVGRAECSRDAGTIAQHRSENDRY